MNMETVGMENLPNVYIDNIVVLPIDDGSGDKLIRVVVTMCDNEEKPSWRGRIDDLKLRCINLRSNTVTSRTHWMVGLHKLSNANSTAKYAALKEISCNDMNKYKSENGYVYFKKELTFRAPANSKQVWAFAACFIDGFGFGIDQFDKFVGPQSAEAILLNGEIVNTTSYFYYPDTNEEYGGPVHAHPEIGWMTGSKHTPDSRRLIKVDEENYKIVDGISLFNSISNLGEVQ